MTKQEAIKEAYGEYWEQVKVFVDENGWVFFSDDENILRLNFQQKDNISTEKTDVESWKWRPKSLQGIENNNGWIKIENEKDLPKDLTECDYIFKGKIERGIFQCLHFDRPRQGELVEYKSVTHYQPIEKKELPIY